MSRTKLVISIFEISSPFPSENPRTKWPSVPSLPSSLISSRVFNINVRSSLVQVWVSDVFERRRGSSIDYDIWYKTRVFSLKIVLIMLSINTSNVCLLRFACKMLFDYLGWGHIHSTNAMSTLRWVWSRVNRWFSTENNKKMSSVFSEIPVVTTMIIILFFFWNESNNNWRKDLLFLFYFWISLFEHWIFCWVKMLFCT